MEAQGVVKLAKDVGREHAALLADTLDGDRPNLLRLGLRVTVEVRRGGAQQHLERVHALDVGGDRDDGDHARPSRVAVEFAATLLTMTEGRRLLASAPRAGSSSTSWMAHRRMRYRLQAGVGQHVRHRPNHGHNRRGLQAAADCRSGARPRVRERTCPRAASLPPP